MSLLDELKLNLFSSYVCVDKTVRIEKVDETDAGKIFERRTYLKYKDTETGKEKQVPKRQSKDRNYRRFIRWHDGGEKTLDNYTRPAPY